MVITVALAMTSVLVQRFSDSQRRVAADLSNTGVSLYVLALQSGDLKRDRVRKLNELSRELVENSASAPESVRESVISADIHVTNLGHALTVHNEPAAQNELANLIPDAQRTAAMTQDWHHRLEATTDSLTDALAIAVWICIGMAIVFGFAPLRRRLIEQERTNQRAARRVAELQAIAQRQSITNQQLQNARDHLLEDVVSNKQEIDILKRSQRRTQLRVETLMTGLPIACFTFDTNASITEWNEQAQSIFGTTAAQAIGTTPCQAIQTHELHAIRGSVARVLAGETIKNGHRIILGPDSSARTITYSAFSTYDGQGNVLGGVFACIDITEQERAHASERIATNKLDQTLSHIDQAFFALSSDYRFEYVNPTAEATFGLEAVAGADVTFWDALPEDANSELGRGVRRGGESGVAVRFEYLQTASNRWFDVRVFPVASGLSVFLDDITEKVVNAEIIARNELMLRTALREMHDAVVITDAQGVVQTCNHKASEILGIEEKTAIGLSAGKKLALLVGDDGKPIPSKRRPLERARKGESVIEEPFRLVRPNGEIRWVTVNACPILSPDGSVELALASFRDDTELIQSRQELQTRLEAYEAMLLEIRAKDGEIRSAKSQLTKINFEDSLTQLPNSRSLDRHLSNPIDCPPFIVFVDINNLKDINEKQSYRTGDQILKQTATALQSALFDGETLFRVGGDEFAILTSESESLQTRIQNTIGSAELPAVTVKVTRVNSRRSIKDIMIGDRNENKNAA